METPPNMLKEAPATTRFISPVINADLCKFWLHAVMLAWIEKSIFPIKTKAGENVSRKFQNM